MGSIDVGALEQAVAVFTAYFTRGDKDSEGYPLFADLCQSYLLDGLPDLAEIDDADAAMAVNLEMSKRAGVLIAGLLHLGGLAIEIAADSENATPLDFLRAAAASIGADEDD